MILFTVLFFVLLTGYGQKLIINDSIYRKGIYKTFEEFKYNKPSIEFNYDIIIKNRGYGLLNTAGQLAIYKILINKKVGKSIGNIFGFCDGKNVYINDNSPRLSPKTEFSKIEYFGKYCYYKEIYNQKVSTPKSRAEINIKSTRNISISNNVRRIKNRSETSTEGRLVEKIINIDSGKVIKLSIKTLRDIITNDKELLDEFNKESQQSKKLREYLIRFIDNQ